MKLPKQIPREVIQEALTNKGDFEVSLLARRLRKRFVVAVCKNLFGCRVETAQKRVFAK